MPKEQAEPSASWGPQEEEHRAEFLQGIVDRATGVDLIHSINANPATPSPDSADALEAGQGVNIGSGATIFCFHHFPPEQTLFGWTLTEQHVRELANQGVDAY